MALFDYDPVSMSPNPDAGEEELPFREGQILKVMTHSLVLLPPSFPAVSRRVHSLTRGGTQLLEPGDVEWGHDCHIEP